MSKYKLLLLANEIDNDHILWEKACQTNLEVSYRIVNLTANNWLENIESEPFDILLAKPGGLTSSFKKLYDERIYILSKELKYKVFPSLDEIFIYENKRFLSFWLKANRVKHPKTEVFYDINDAKEYISKTTEKIVAKTNIGASGKGVRILKTNREKINYINQTFHGKGAPQRSGPNFKKGKLFKRGLHYIFNPKDIKKKLKLYKTASSSLQKGFVIFQKFIPHDFEWRVVRIGDSFFAHKKLKLGEKTSGSTLKSYDNPPLSLLSFVKELTDKHKFYSLAVDIFESGGNYYINEMQCIFGQSDDYQMKVDEKIGRYIWVNNEWKFEEGDYCQNECYNLRLEYIINNIINA